MSLYFTLTKQNYREDDLPIFSADCNLMWPTFLNCITSQSADLFEKCINKNNYMFTRSSFIRDDREVFSDWLMRSDLASKGALMKSMAELGTSTKFIDKYPITYEDNKCEVIVSAVSGDNVDCLRYLREKEKLGQYELITLLYTAMQDDKASKCTRYLAEELGKYPDFSLEFGIWSILFGYGDHSITKALGNHLKCTSRTQTGQRKEYGIPLLKDIIVGSYGEVKNALEKIDSSDFYCISYVIARIAQEEEYADLVQSFLTKRNLLKDDAFVNELGMSVLASTRDPEDTEKIIRSLQQRGLVFKPSLKLTYREVSAQSWIAVIKTKDFFDFSNCVVEYLGLNVKMMLPENRKTLCQALETIVPKCTPETVTDIFLGLGTSISQWGYGKGLLKKIHDPRASGLMAAKCGNVFMMALAIEQSKECDDPLRFHHFAGKTINPEALQCLKAWISCNPEDKKTFMEQPFSEDFYDSSLWYNNPMHDTFSYGLSSQLYTYCAHN